MLDAFFKATDGKKTFYGALAYTGMTFAVSMGWVTPEAMMPWIALAEKVFGIGVLHRAYKVADLFAAFAFPEHLGLDMADDAESRLCPSGEDQVA